MMRRHFLLAMARRMLAHDLRAALLRRAGDEAVAALGSYGSFLWWLTLRNLESALLERGATLTQRLEGPPGYATRAAPLADDAPASCEAPARRGADGIASAARKRR